MMLRLHPEPFSGVFSSYLFLRSSSFIVGAAAALSWFELRSTASSNCRSWYYSPKKWSATLHASANRTLTGFTFISAMSSSVVEATPIWCH